MADSAEALAARQRSRSRAGVLGRFRVIAADGRDLTPKGRKTRALAAFLLLNPQPVSRERLKGLLWGDRGEDQASASLRQALYELREMTAEPDALFAVTREAAGRIAPPHDLMQIEAAAAAGDLPGLTALLGRDVELLTDLDGVGADFDAWLALERPRWRDRLVDQAIAAAQGAEPAATRRLADRLEQIDPLNEPAVRLGLAADHAQGDLASLHRRYRRFEERLRDDLGARPSAETQGLFETLSQRRRAAISAGDAPVRASPRPRLGLSLILGLALVLLGGLTAAGVLAWKPGPAPVATAPPAVAILPFGQAAGSPEEAYFGAGVADEIRGLLAPNAKLRSVGGRSARLLAAEPDPMAAARRLAIGYLVDGQVRHNGERSLVSARLRRVSDGKVVWSQAYDRPIEDIFAIQSEIAAAVAQQFGATLAPASHNPHLVTRPDVYDRFLEARSLARERRVATLEQARDRLKEAIAADPGYAPALASLAQVTMLLADHPAAYGDVPMPQAQADARGYARRALALAPELADGYAAFGLLSLSDAASLPFYERAVALDPQRSDYHRWLAQSYQAVGRQADSLRELRRAAALEPLWSLSTEHLVSQLSYMGRRDEAAQTVARFAQVSTDRRGVDRIRMRLMFDLQDLAGALQIAEEAARQSPQDRQAQTEYAKLLGMLGEDRRAAAALPPSERIGRALFNGPPFDLAGPALTAGPRFWDAQAANWGWANQIVKAGRGEALLRLYDQSFSGPEAFERIEGINAPDIAAAVIAAMLRAGRTEDARRLAERMLARLDSDQRQGVDPASQGYSRAAILAQIGRPAEALDQLELAAKGGWINLLYAPYEPLTERVALRALAGEARLAALQRQLTDGLNGQRRRLGLSSLKT